MIDWTFISKASPKTNPEHIRLHWPQLIAALQEFHIDDALVEAGLAATVCIETAYLFLPCTEKRPRHMTDAEYFQMYAPPHPVALRLGNRSLEDAIKYKGRGDIQITGHDNTAACGIALGLDLLSTPELLLDPVISARAAAWFFSTHKHNGVTIPELCAMRDWSNVRKAVNGGLNDYQEFEDIVLELAA